MSHVQHLTVLVTSWNRDELTFAKEKALDIFKKSMVTDTANSIVNGYGSFMVCTSGSKADWTEDIEHQKQINEFVKFLDSNAYNQNKNDNFLQYVVLSYGDCGVKVEQTNQVDKFIQK